MEQITVIIGIVAVVSWTVGFGFVYGCVVLVMWALIQQAAGSLQRASTSPAIPLNLAAAWAKQISGAGVHPLQPVMATRTSA